MNIRLHKNARTTPAIRREIQAATGSDYELAERFGVTRQTIRKWESGVTIAPPVSTGPTRLLPLLGLLSSPADPLSENGVRFTYLLSRVNLTPIFFGSVWGNGYLGQRPSFKLAAITKERALSS